MPGASVFNEMLNTDDALYKYNSAIALGLIDDKRALPVLRNIVQKRDSFFFTDNRRSNQFRSAVAVCLLGRLGDVEDLPMLFEILSNEEINRPMYHTLSPNYLYHNFPDRNFVYFSMLTHTCMAIYRIYKRCNLDMKELQKFFSNLFRDDDVLKRVTDGDFNTAAREEMNGFTEHILRLTAQLRE